MLLAYDPAGADPAAFGRRLERLAYGQDRHTALAASQWLSVTRENAGDAAGAMEAAQRTLELVSEDEGPWSTAMPRTMLAQLTMHMGDRAAAAGHARAALPVMRRLGASDDEVQLRAVLVLCAIADGRLADARDELSQADALGEGTTLFGSDGMREACRAELALASGDHATGLRMYRDCAARMQAVRIPGFPLTGLEPWVLFGEAAALSAHARYAAASDEEPSDAAHGRSLFLACRDRALRLFRARDPDFDYPAAGLLLCALGAWALLHEPQHEPRPESRHGPRAATEAAGAGVAVRLLALADRFAYNRTIPTMSWDWITAAADEAAPARLAACRAGYAGRQPADLLAEARRLTELLPAQ